jgi:hypothetical protein
MIFAKPKKRKSKSTEKPSKRSKKEEEDDDELLGSSVLKRNWDKVTDLAELRNAIKSRDEMIDKLKKEVATLKKSQPKPKNVDPEKLANQLKRSIT